MTRWRLIDLTRVHHTGMPIYPHLEIRDNIDHLPAR
jgi:hypothetical protein